MSSPTQQDGLSSSSSPAATDPLPPPPSAGTTEATTTDGRPLTNKEKRKALQASKRAAREAKLAPPPTASTETERGSTAAKRKRADDDEDGGAQEGEEVEPLSHKEQRRRRKMEKSGRGDKAAGERRRGGAAAGGAVQQVKRSPYSIWVGNLRFSTDEAKLKEWLEGYEVVGITRVYMPKGPKRGECNKGFAYVDLPSEAMVEHAVALSETRLDGRNLLIKSGSDFQGRPQLNASAASLAMSALGTGPPLSASASASSHPRPATGSNASDLPSLPLQHHQQPQQPQTQPDSIAFSAVPVSTVRGKTGLTKTAQKILRAQRNPPGPTLFLGNLSFETTEEGIRSLLESSAQRREQWRRADRAERKERRVRKRRDGGDRSGSESEADSAASDSASDSDSGSGSDSGSDSTSNEDGAERSKLRTAASGKTTSSTGGIRGAGIRKIRLGTFEDSGKCKGFGFVDFHTAEHATAALVDGRNSRLDGREIVVQYAGADAVRRGAPKGSGTDRGRDRRFGGRSGGERRGRWEERPDRGGAGKRMEGRDGGRVEREEEEEVERLRATAPERGTFDPAKPVERHKETQEERRARRAAEGAGGGKPGRRGRARPGMVLANAQREKVGIVASEGKKITFE